MHQAAIKGELSFGSEHFEIGCVYRLLVSRTINSLFKVLFKFPSLYLSAISLVAVFSLTWGLPRP